MKKGEKAHDKAAAAGKAHGTLKALDGTVHAASPLVLCRKGRHGLHKGSRDQHDEAADFF